MLALTRLNHAKHHEKLKKLRGVAQGSYEIPGKDYETSCWYPQMRSDDWEGFNVYKVVD